MIEARTAQGDVLDRPVLVLNRCWQAINVCSVRRAVTLLCAGHAAVVDENNGEFNTYDFGGWCAVSAAAPGGGMIHSPSLSLRRPTIIVLASYDRLPGKEVRYSRGNVFYRDKHTCQYCRQRLDRSELNIDHVIPRDRGGQTTWTNVVCSCLRCNSLKGNRTPEEAGMTLLKPPRKPLWQPFLEMQFAKSYDPSWRHFLDFPAWRVEMGES